MPEKPTQDTRKPAARRPRRPRRAKLTGAAAAAAARRKAAAAKRRRKARAEAVRIAALTPLEAPHTKGWPWSEGTMTGNRKKKPQLLAITNDNCTGCAGSPVCINYCPVDECMYWIDDEDHPPFGRIEVDGQTCIGCKQCVAKGPDGTFLDGCPWDAIDMVPIAEVEAQFGVKYEF
jgi:ferredoxin